MTTSICNHDLINTFLADRLTDAQQAAFERHLDECDSCCMELQRRTADDGLWHEAKSFLSSSDHVGQASSLPSNNSANPVPIDLLSNRDTPLQLDFLAPTDDPRMLGRFAGHEISGVVGCGGMGIVLKGFDPALNRYAAIKVLSPHYATSGAARQRFAREAQAAAAVVHDNVIAIHGVSEFNSVPYLIMPYIKGQSLQKRIDRHGPLSTAEILRIAMQTARGLAAAHDQGLVHRDIKPANILLPENVERVMITDFGLARAADDASLTRSGVIAGTPQYMSPEQAKGEGIDHRSDLFSLGSVMYAMATGHPPFRAETPYGILRRITDQAHRPLQEVNPEIPLWLSAIVDRLLAKEANQRFASADEVASLLEDCLAHVQQPTVVELPAILQPRLPAKSSSRRFQFRYAAIALLLIIVPFIWMLWWPPERLVASRRSVTVGNDKQLPAASAEPLMEELQWHPDDGLSSVETTLTELNHELDSVFPE
jgi:serine/threonine protein kinase